MQSTSASNDADTFIDLLTHHRPMVFRYIVMLVPQSADAEEVFQQTCLTMWEKWSEGVVPEYFGAWARTIAYNHVRNALRSRRRLPGLFTDELLEAIHARAQRLDDDSETRVAAMEGCIKKLPGDHRDVVKEYYRSGRTVDQIAKQMGRPVQGLYKLLQRIRNRLLECINRRLRESEG